MKTFVINLKKRIDRKKHVTQTYPKNSLSDMEIIQACDGKNPKNNTNEINKEVIKFISVNQKNNNKFFIKYGELGAFVSHLYLWKRMIKENIQKALIMEDDIKKFEGEFDKYIKEIDLIDNNKFHIIWLNYPSSNMNGSTNYISNNIYSKKNIHFNTYLGVFGYVITLQGAKYLIDYYENIYKNRDIYAVDRFMSYAYKNLDYHYTRNQLVYTSVWHVANKTDSSDISNTDIQLTNENISCINNYKEIVMKELNN